MYPLYELYFLYFLSHVEYLLGNGLRFVENPVNFPLFPFVVSATTTCSLCTCRMFCELKSTERVFHGWRERAREGERVRRTR